MRPIFDKDLPIHKQLANELKESILQGKFICGDKLPTIRENAAKNNVSLTTAMNAYQELENDGLVVHAANQSYIVSGNSSVYINEYYLNRIKELYNEIEKCCKIANIPDAIMHLKNIKNNKKNA